MAVAYIFGLHPLFMVMSPEITEEDLLEASTVGTEVEFSQEKLDETIAYLTR